jgi:hypothetical protein
MGRREFDELIAKMRDQPSETEEGLPASIYDDLSAEYDAISEGSSAKVNELQSQLQNRESEISRLKSANYDLLMNSAGDTANSSEDEDEDTSGSKGIDSLFNLGT